MDVTQALEAVIQSLKALRDAINKDLAEGPRRDVPHTILLANVSRTVDLDVTGYTVELRDWNRGQ